MFHSVVVDTASIVWENGHSLDRTTLVCGARPLTGWGAIAANPVQLPTVIVRGSSESGVPKILVVTGPTFDLPIMHTALGWMT